jgi:Fe-S oxidoreductase
MPTQRGSGYPYIGYGDLKRARRAADENVRNLAAYASQGYDIVATEPTAVYALKISYPKLLNDRQDSKDVATRTYEFFEYLQMLEGDAPRETPASLAGRRLGFHIPSHQRALGAGVHALKYLRQRGAEVEVIETGTCCGMAGTFGLKAGFLGYELSQAVGEPLFLAFKESGVEAIVTESSVCSIHLKEGTGMVVRHPLEFPFD